MKVVNPNISTESLVVAFGADDWVQFSVRWANCATSTMWERKALVKALKEIVEVLELEVVDAAELEE